jgi:hypothetical protein
MVVVVVGGGGGGVKRGGRKGEEKGCLKCPSDIEEKKTN